MNMSNAMKMKIYDINLTNMCKKSNKQARTNINGPYMNAPEKLLKASAKYTDKLR